MYLAIARPHEGVQGAISLLENGYIRCWVHKTTHIIERGLAEPNLADGGGIIDEPDHLKHRDVHGT